MQIITWKKTGYNRKILRRRRTVKVPGKNLVITEKNSGFGKSQYQLRSQLKERKEERRKQKEEISKKFVQ